MISFRFESASYSKRSGIQTITVSEVVKKPCVFRSVKVWNKPNFCPVICKDAPTKICVKFTTEKALKQIVNNEYEVTNELYAYVMNYCTDVEAMITDLGEGLRKKVRQIIRNEAEKELARMSSWVPAKIGLSSLFFRKNKTLILAIDLERKRVIDVLSLNENRVGLKTLDEFVASIEEKSNWTEWVYVSEKTLDSKMMSLVADKRKLTAVKPEDFSRVDAKTKKHISTINNKNQIICCRISAKTPAQLRRLIALKRI